MASATIQVLSNNMFSYHQPCQESPQCRNFLFTPLWWVSRHSTVWFFPGVNIDSSSVYFLAFKSGHGHVHPVEQARQHPGSVLAVVEWQVPLHLFRGDLCRRCFFFALNFDLVIILPVVTILTFFLSLLPGPMLICLVRLVSKLFGRNLQVLVRLLVLSLAGLVKTGGGASAPWDPGPADTK